MRFYLVTALFVLVGYVVFLAQQNQPTASNFVIENIIDENMLGVTAERFSDGKLTQTLSMQAWSHKRDNNNIDFQSPVLAVINNGVLTWRISSRKGLGFQAQKGHFDKLFLSEDVTLLYFNESKTPEWKLTTSELWYYPDKRNASAKNLVNIEGPNMTLQSLGLEADLSKHQIEFLSQVKTVYEKYH